MSSTPTSTSHLLATVEHLDARTIDEIASRFPTVGDLRNVDVDQLAALPNVTPTQARRVHHAATTLGDPTEVDAFVHADKRLNLPSDEQAHLVDPTDTDGPAQMLYPRDPDLDPQLVWRGKDDLDAEPLAVPVVPLFIQERVDPRVLIENIRNTADKPETEPELTLFDDFDGLDDPTAASVEFYEHDANWSNRLILGDALVAMTSLAEKENLKGKVQTIYIDPPYGIKFQSNWQVSTRDRSVADGKDLTPQPEQIRAFRDTWNDGINSYLTYLRDRLVSARSLLNETGSVFVQISDDNLHVVRNLLDEVFGPQNYVSTITFAKTSSASGSGLATVADFIVWYARDIGQMKYRQLYKRKQLGAEGTSGYTKLKLADGSERRLTRSERAGIDKLEAGSRVFRLDNLTSQRPARGSDLVEFDFEGATYTPGRGTWKTDKAGLERLAAAGRLAVSGRTLSYVRYLDDFDVFAVSNVWTDTGTAGFASNKTYVVQTNPSVIERCVLMTSDPGDLVLDPTCGSGTTAVVAEKWGRRWITIDTSRVALALARRRLMGSRYPFFTLADSPDGAAAEEAETGQVRLVERFAHDIRRGFVYRRALHIMLSTISRCEEIQPGMTQVEIDAAVRRAAEYETIFDEPHEDKTKVRVTGPFTVETLTPHRTIDASDTTGATDFVEAVLDNLGTAGVQNGYVNERLNLDWVEPHPGTWIHALGGFADSDGADKTVAISVGSDSGTVGREHVTEAAKEALREARADLLLICAFSFDAGAGEQASTETEAEHVFSVDGERTVGRLRVLNVRVNTDLMMSEDLKNTGAGNLFTVFGEPDIDVEDIDSETVAVTIHGLDVYDPNKGTVRSSDPNDIACWFIDTNYNGDAFFVRHAYFTGGSDDPFASLKSALQADIDLDAWSALTRTTSIPFAKPSTGKIAVKAINHYGDEALKVLPCQ